MARFLSRSGNPMNMFRMIGDLEDAHNNKFVNDSNKNWSWHGFELMCQ